MQAMEKAGKVAIAKVVMRSKEHLVALRPKDGSLVMSTMVYADELVNSAGLPGAEELQNLEEPTKAELLMADQLIESLSVDFVAEDYEDSHREKLLAMIEKKASGEAVAITSADAEENAAVLDLMAALEASVNEAKEAQGDSKSA